MKLNNPIVGLLIGLIMPLFGLVVMKFMWFRFDEFGVFIHRLVTSRDMMFKVCSLSMLANLIPFVWFNTKRFDHGARGVFIATMLYVVFLVLVRYVW